MRSLRLCLAGILLGLGTGWCQNLTASLSVDAATPLKTIDSKIYGSNVEWFYDANLIWDVNSQANNPMIVSRTQALGVTLLRFPGGTLADYYHWRNGIGPRTSRPIMQHGIDDGAEVNNFGLHEFLDFCRSTGAQPVIQTNVITGTASEAADWVQYSNAAVNTERTANGSPAPFGIKYWEIGNEPYIRNWTGSGGASLLSVGEYTQRFISHAIAMKAADPTIKVGAVGGKNFGRYALLSDDAWNQSLLVNAGQYIDFLSLHNGYAPIITQPQGLGFVDVYGAMLAFPQLVADNLKTVNQQIVQYAPVYANNISIAVTEWGPLFDVLPSNPYVGHAKTLGSGVFIASMLRAFLTADRVSMANFFQLTSPLFLGSIYCDGVVKPSYLAMQLYTKYFGTTLVSTSTTSSPTYNSVALGMMDAVQKVPYVEAISSVSADRKKTYVMIINKHLTSSVTTTVQLRNFAPASKGTVRFINAASADANNGNDLPVIPGVVWATQAVAPANPMFNAGAAGTVAIRESSFTAGTQVKYTAPPISVSVLEYTAK